MNRKPVEKRVGCRSAFLMIAIVLLSATLAYAGCRSYTINKGTTIISCTECRNAKGEIISVYCW